MFQCLQIGSCHKQLLLLVVPTTIASDEQPKIITLTAGRSSEDAPGHQDGKGEAGPHGDRVE